MSATRRFELFQSGGSKLTLKQLARMKSPEDKGYPNCTSYDIDMIESYYIKDLSKIQGALTILKHDSRNFADPGPLEIGYCNCTIEKTIRNQLEFNDPNYHSCYESNSLDDK